MMFIKTKTKKAVLIRYLDSGRRYRRNFDVTLYSSNLRRPVTASHLYTQLYMPQAKYISLSKEKHFLQLF